MKKFLSLALALVMTMSLVTVSASATFTDDSEIVYDEAVAVLTAIEVVGGYADGSFDPDATLTRGAAAKIICNLMLGPTVASALGTNTDPFPDVSYDHTFAGYIAYCANEGIISGYSDGTFRPSGTITGYAFMKMLLGALGYDSAVEGYTDTNWAVNVSADAKTSNLDDGNEDYDGSKAITREEACLYALNTLKAEVISYDSQSNITIGDIVISNSSKAETSGKYSELDYFGGSGLGMDTVFMEENFSKLNVNTGEDSFERPALVWEYKNDEIGTYVDPSDLVASFEGSVSKDDIYDELGDEDYNYTVYVDGDKDNTFSDIDDIAKENSSTTTVGSGKGSITEIYDVSTDDDELYVIVTINTYLVQATDDYDDDNEVLEVALLNEDYSLDDDELSIDDFAVSDFEDEDYILVTANNNGSNVLTIQSVVAAEVVSGEVSSYSSTNYVYLDGSKYSYSATADNKSENFSSGEEATAVLDAQGYIIHVDSLTAGYENYVFIYAFDSSSSLLSTSNTYYAGAYFTDGTYAEIEIDELDGKDVITDGYDDGGDNKDGSGDEILTNTGSAAYPASDWYTYTANSDGTYDLYKVVDYTVEEVCDEEISNGAVKYDNTNRGTSSTVFVVYDGDDVYTYTGINNVPDVTEGTDGSVKSYTLNDGSYAAYVFIDGSDSSVKTSTANAADYIFILDAENTYKDSDGDTIYPYNAIVDGEEVTIDLTSAATEYALYDELLSDGDYYELGDEVAVLDSNNDPAYSDSDIGDASAVAIAMAEATVSYSSSVLSIDNADETDESDMYVDSDTEIYLVAMCDDLMDDDAADYEVSNISASKLKSTLSDYVVTGAFYAVFEDSDSTTLSAIYVVVGEVGNVDTYDVTRVAKADAVNYIYMSSTMVTEAETGDTVEVSFSGVSGSIESIAAGTLTVLVNGNALETTVGVTAGAVPTATVSFTMTATEAVLTMTFAAAG